MSKYCYVTFNDIDKVKEFTEKYCIKIVVEKKVSLEYTYVLYGAAITNVFPCIINKKVYGFFRNKIEQETAYTKECLIVCEEKDDYLEDIITGERFIKTPYSSNKHGFTSELTARIEKSLTEQEVVNYLKKFNEQDLIRYKTGMKNFIDSYNKGYNEYINKMKLLEEKKEKTLSYNRQYIENFKNNNRD